MTKEEGLVKLRALVLSERACRTQKEQLVFTAERLARLIGCDKGHVQWMLSQLAHEGIMFTRRSTESDAFSHRRFPKQFRMRIDRREAARRCKELGIDLSKYPGMHPTNPRLRDPTCEPMYEVPQFD